MIEIKQLRKSFKNLTAVDNISLKANAGEIFGLLGPNGAGKSTTINCICGLTQASEGSISINGFNISSQPKQSKQSLGLVPQELALYEDLSAHENLLFWGSAYGLKGKNLEQRIQQTLIAVGLESRQKEAVKNYSGGMKRRLNFACAILHKPAALLLDEPTVGVDPQSREHLLESIIKLKNAGTSVIYTTHYMEEAERICDKLAIIDQGKIIASGTVKDLRAQVGERDLITIKGAFQNIEQLQSFAQLNIEILEFSTQEIKILAEDASTKLTELLNLVESSHGSVSHVAIQQASLESLFIKLTGRGLRDHA